jgi:biotin carboxyl carrier protein
MDYQFLLDGKLLAVKAERTGDSLTLTLPEGNHTFMVAELGKCEYLLRQNGMQNKVVALKVSNKIYSVTDCCTVVLELPADKDGDTFGSDHGEHGDKSRVVAPMPGKVVKVLVEVGQNVEPKQKLLIVEAMKMENPLIAPFKAEVVKINCATGELVDSDKVLIELRQLT